MKRCIFFFHSVKQYFPLRLSGNSPDKTEKCMIFIVGKYSEENYVVLINVSIKTLLISSPKHLWYLILI